MANIHVVIVALCTLLICPSVWACRCVGMRWACWCVGKFVGMQVCRQVCGQVCRHAVGHSIRRLRLLMMPPPPPPPLLLPQIIVNLYPFRQTVTASPPPSFDVGVENIDIGGPAMIRAAAKNMAHVCVVVDPADYPTLLDSLAPGTSPAQYAEFRKRMAWKAFQVRGAGVTG